MADYQIFLATPTGQKIRVLHDYITCDYSLVANGVGACSLALPKANYTAAMFDRGYQIIIERDAAIEGSGPFFIIKRPLDLDGSGQYLWNISALHQNVLLQRRWIMYYAGHAQAKATSEAADDAMRRLASYNLGDNANDGDRDAAAPIGLVDVETDTSQGATTTKSFSRRPLLTVLQELAQTSRENGTPLFFGLEDDSSSNTTFKVRTDQWGQDRRASVIVSPEVGNLSGGNRTTDWSNEVTKAFTLGQGEGVNRGVGSAEKTTLTSENDMFYIEGVRDSRHLSLQSSLDAEAEAMLIERQPMETFSGKIQETTGFQYGVDWGWGDKLSAEFNGLQFYVWVNAVQVALANGEEAVTPHLEVIQ